MAYSQEIKDYARDLFLTDDGLGDHKYNKADITREIPIKFPDLKKYPDESTVRTWINAKDKDTKKSWLDQWQDGQRAGFRKAAAELNDKLDAEEKIEIRVDTVMRDRANRALALCEKPDKKLAENKTLDLQDVRQIKLSETIFNNLNLEKQRAGPDPLEIDYDYLDEVDEDDLGEAEGMDECETKE